MKRLRKVITAGIIGIIGLAGIVQPVGATAAAGDIAGMIQTSVYAGSVDATNVAEESLKTPLSVLPLQDGSILVADSVNQVIRQIKDGELSIYSGIHFVLDDEEKLLGALIDGAKDSSAFHNPNGLASDAAGNIYVADTSNHAIRKIAIDGTVTTFAGNGVIGSQDGSGAEAGFYNPSDVAVAADGTIYVADTLNHAIRKITADGKVTTLNAASERVVEIVPGIVEDAGDYKDGAISEAKFNEPSGLALDAKGNLYVSDSGNQRIRYIDFAANKVTTVAGSVFADGSSVYAEHALYADGDFADGAADRALFNMPKGLAVTPEGGLLIADSENHVVRYLLDGQVTTVIGQPGEHGSINGIEGYNLLYRPTDVALASDGSILVADSYNNVIRQVRAYALPEGIPTNHEIKVVYNQEWIAFDALPEFQNQRTMVPARKIAEAVGYTVDYEEEGRKVTLSNSRESIEFNIDQTKLTKRDSEGKIIKTVELDSAPYEKASRTYVPVRFFAEEIGLDVQWIEGNQIVVLRDKVIR